MYSALAEAEAVILVYGNGSRKIVVAPTFKTNSARRNATYKTIDEARKDPLVRAILTSARSYDVFETLQKKARGKSVEYVLDNWKKYWTEEVGSKTLAF